MIRPNWSPSSHFLAPRRRGEQGAAEVAVEPRTHHLLRGAGGGPRRTGQLPRLGCRPQSPGAHAHLLSTVPNLIRIRAKRTYANLSICD